MKNILYTLIICLFFVGCNDGNSESVPTNEINLKENFGTISIGEETIPMTRYVEMVDRVKTLDDKWEDVNSVSSFISDNFSYKPDGEIDYWSVMRPSNNMIGDCDEVALTCRAMLLGLGWSKDDLGIVYCESYDGFHLVLLFIIDGEQYIMESSRIYPILELNYRWIKIMTGDDDKWYYVE